jgi:quinol monooxygenase YgiN
MEFRQGLTKAWETPNIVGPTRKAPRSPRPRELVELLCLRSVAGCLHVPAGDGPGRAARLCVILGTLRVVIPRQRKEEALSTLRVVRAHARADAACLAYDVCQDVDDSKTLIVIERWATREDLDNHIRSPEYRAFLAVIDLASEPPQLSFDIVEHRGGLEMVEAARSSERGVTPPFTRRPRGP